jgi:RNA polymerase sigma-70 factor (ECF subfamily)
MTIANENPGPKSPHLFVTTHWSVILAARDGDSEHAQRALASLCQSYWYPLYAYLRSRGFSPEDSEDLTQGLFVQLLERKSLQRADRERGKFRFFLLGALKNYLCDEHDKATALKRGGGQRPISLDAQTAEERFRFEPIDTLSPEKIFERRWALTLLDQALARLKAEQVVARKEQLYNALEGFLTQAEDMPSYEEVAARLRLPLSTVKSSLYRLRQRHRELLREEIAQTVTTAAEIEEEIQHFISALSL